MLRALELVPGQGFDVKGRNRRSKGKIHLVVVTQQECACKGKMTLFDYIVNYSLKTYTGVDRFYSRHYQKKK
jgi:hypothetical protein